MPLLSFPKYIDAAQPSLSQKKLKKEYPYTDNHLLVSRSFYFISIYCHLVSCLQVCCFICTGHVFFRLFFLLCARFFDENSRANKHKIGSQSRQTKRASNMQVEIGWLEKSGFSVCYITCLMVPSHLENLQAK